MNNFEFLKPIDSDLYNIISEAEKLYRDEYFEQCISQTRKFGENVCRSILAPDLPTGCSFDDMLATLNDKPQKSEEEKEFLNDLYFIKREGNASVHSASVTKDGIVALECLQRAFEIALNYTVFYKKADTDLLNLHYNTEILATGAKSSTVSEKYQKVKKTTAPAKKQSHHMPTKNYAYDKEIKFPYKFVGIALIFALILGCVIFMLTI